MRIAVIGGGPGGLYFAYLWKRRHPEVVVELFEQNEEGATWGFGVVFSDQALEFLRADDPETVDAITARMESWRNITVLMNQPAAFRKTVQKQRNPADEQQSRSPPGLHTIS